jgi:hypothetical protein
MSNVSLTHPFMSSSVFLHPLDVTSSMGFLTWEDLVRARVSAVALATTRHFDQVVCLVVPLCEDYADFCVKTMYCCVKTMGFH